MGRHKQIESILLRELSMGEERSERALEVIHHQQTTINQLEKVLKEHQKECELIIHKNIRQKEIEIEDYLKIQVEVDSLHENLREIKEIQSQLYIPGTNQIAQYQLKVEVIEASVQTHETVQPTFVDSFTEPFVDERKSEIKVDVMKEFQPTLDAFNVDLDETKKKVDRNSHKEITMKRKLNSLRRKVKWLKQERDEMIAFLDELTEWRKHVEGILLDLSAGIQEDVGRVESGDVVSHHTRQIWKTARKYFSSDEAHFFLSHET